MHQPEQQDAPMSCWCCGVPQVTPALVCCCRAHSSGILSQITLALLVLGATCLPLQEYSLLLSVLLVCGLQASHTKDRAATPGTMHARQHHVVAASSALQGSLCP